MIIAILTNKLDVSAKKAGAFSYELCNCKYTDQTDQTLNPILIKPLLGILIAQSEKEGKDQESIQSSTKPDPGHHMGK